MIDIDDCMYESWIHVQYSAQISTDIYTFYKREKNEEIWNEAFYQIVL